MSLCFLFLGLFSWNCAHVEAAATSSPTSHMASESVSSSRYGIAFLHVGCGPCGLWGFVEGFVALEPHNFEPDIFIFWFFWDPPRKKTFVHSKKTLQFFDTRKELLRPTRAPASTQGGLGWVRVGGPKKKVGTVRDGGLGEGAPGGGGPGGSQNFAFFFFFSKKSPDPLFVFVFFLFPMSFVELRWSLRVFNIETVFTTHISTLQMCVCEHIFSDENAQRPPHFTERPRDTGERRGWEEKNVICWMVRGRVSRAGVLRAGVSGQGAKINLLNNHTINQSTNQQTNRPTKQATKHAHTPANQPTSQPTNQPHDYIIKGFFE